MNLGKYGKFITGIIGLAVTILSQKYGGALWFTYVVGAASALGIYGVPNSTSMTKGDLNRFRSAWDVARTGPIEPPPDMLITRMPPSGYPVQPVAKQVQESPETPTA